MLRDDDFEMRFSPPWGTHVDVAVVGAGISGVYTGYRLLTGERRHEQQVAPWMGRDRRPTVHVFELSDRVGGRLESVRLPEMPNLRAELGGMAFLTSQQLIASLVKLLGLGEDLEHFSFGEPATNRAYFRGRSFTQSQWTDPSFQNPYRLEPPELGKSTDQVFSLLVREIVAKAGYPFPKDARQWDELKPLLRFAFEGPFKGERLVDLGFWNVLQQLTYSECYAFLADVGGFYSNTMNWNAVEACPSVVENNFAPDYFTIRGGYDRTPRRLARLFTEAGGTVWGKCQLARFHRWNDRRGGPYVLEFNDLQSGEITTIMADQVVLAMPRRSLELLGQDNFLFKDNPGFRRDVRSVVNQPAFKVYMGFREPWWTRRLDIKVGWSITDLPMRQCAYIGTEAKYDPGNHNSMLMASFNDMRTVAFWKPLQQRESMQPYVCAPALGSAEVQCFLDESGPSHAAPARMVGVVLEQLKLLHDLKEIPEPYVAVYRDWAEDPYGGAYHGWKPHIETWHVMPRMRQPLPDELMHVCGEAYSGQQGQAEGALCTAEKMLQEHFDMKWPSWLPRGYYLGY